jgi:mersacidin/lichenicidin family type 2 lantibiotic
MSKSNVIRAWKDAKYRRSLSTAELESLPAHPAGGMELDDASLDAALGGCVWCEMSDYLYCSMVCIVPTAVHNVCG